MNELQGLLDTIQANDRISMLQRIADDPALLDARTERGQSPVLFALYRGQLEAARLLLALDPRLDVFDAAAAGVRERVVELVGADPRLLRAHAPDGFTPLHLAAVFGRSTIVEWLLAHGARVDAVATDGSLLQPLHSALVGRDEPAAVVIARALLERGASANARQAGGLTALHLAVARGSRALVRLLVANGGDLRRKTQAGQTAVDLARAHGHVELAERLASTQRKRASDG